MSLRRRESLSESPQPSEMSMTVQQLVSNAPVVDTDVATSGADTDSTVPGETIHLKPGNFRCI